MKALFVALGINTGVGGLERFNQRVVRCLQELAVSRNLESCAIALWDSARDGGAAPVTFFPGHSHKFRTAATFALQARRMQPDVIFYGHVLLAPLASLARVLSPKSRHILFVHGREVWREPFRTRIPVWQRWAVRMGMDRIAAVSLLTAERMKNAFRVPEGVFELLPNAVDLPLAPPKPRSDGNGDFRLLTVTRLGWLDRYKGCAKVIRAMPAILERVPQAQYELVGEGPLKQELIHLSSELGVRDHIQFHGYVDDSKLAEIYARANLLVMPSTGEGFGIVFLEAWKHGLPVVAGNVDASGEVVTDGVNGFCVDPESIPKIAEAILSLARDEARSKAMGEAGYRTVLDRYSHQHFRERLERILCS